MTGMPSVSARRIGAASRGTPGLLTTHPGLVFQSIQITIQVDFDAGVAQPFRARRIPGVDSDDPLAPAARRRAAAWPDRARPTTRYGPAGRGGRSFDEAMAPDSPDRAGTLP